jgi:hypothetical protein
MQNAKFSFATKKGTILIKILLPIEKQEVPASIAIQNINYKSPVMAFAR